MPGAILQRCHKLRMSKRNFADARLIEAPINLHLDILPDTIFSRVKNIVRILTSHRGELFPKELKMTKELGKNSGNGFDFFYQIDGGLKQTAPENLTPIYNSFMMARPKLLSELDIWVTKYGEPELLILK